MDMMKAISRSQHMRFVDGSAATENDLLSLKASPHYRLINIGADREDGMGWGAGNLGLSAYEVAIGFSVGSNPAEAHRFADMVVGTLKQKWQVYVVPPGRGALPLKNCSSQQNDTKPVGYPLDRRYPVHLSPRRQWAADHRGRQYRKVHVQRPRPTRGKDRERNDYSFHLR